MTIGKHILVSFLPALELDVYKFGRIKYISETNTNNLRDRQPKDTNSHLRQEQLERYLDTYWMW